MTNHHFFSLSFLAVVTLAVTSMGTHAINIYNFVNRAGSSAEYACFTREIRVSYARQTLIIATYDIWKWFEQYLAVQRKDANRLILILENFPDSQVQVSANATTNEIHLNGRYIASYSGDVKREIIGVVYHELTHVLQWNGNGQAPGWLIEGIADYVRLRSCYIPSNWVKPGEGDSFYEGYDVTTRFLDYCTCLRSNFVVELIKNPAGWVSMCALATCEHECWTEKRAPCEVFPAFWPYHKAVLNG